MKDPVNHKDDFQLDADDLLAKIDPLARSIEEANELYIRSGDPYQLEQLIRRNPNMQPVANMLMAPPVWAAEPWQLCAARNPSYLNSLWLGTVWNIVLLPTRIWKELLRPLLWGRIELFLAMLAFMPLSIAKFFWLGITGRLHSLMLPPDVCPSILLMEDEDAAAVKAMHPNSRMLTLIPNFIMSKIEATAAER